MLLSLTYFGVKDVKRMILCARQAGFLKLLASLLLYKLQIFSSLVGQGGVLNLLTFDGIVC